ncbi:MAG TPA: pyridoxal phosphate-dependent aminotransferase [Thermoanaerobaculia bacterium]|nr:pyridoxal phosphate-dependent aminotransferase [Thermoanaerobaculia bacterium]
MSDGDGRPPGTAPATGLDLDGLSLSLIRRVTMAAAPGAVDLALGEPGHETPAAVRRALAEAAAGPLTYTPNAGLPELRRALAGRRPHHGAGEDSVLVTVGSQEALALGVLGLVRGGDEVLVPRWAYPSYDVLPRLVGARVVRAELGEMAAAVGARTRLIVVGSPANPTGEVADREQLQRLAELVAERGGHLVSDEVYEELHLGAGRPAYPAAANVLHVGGISKSLAATGLRCGWLIADPALVARLLPLHQHLVTCAPGPSQAAALAGLSLPAADLEAIRDLYRGRWRTLRAALATVPGLRWVEPAGAFYVWVDLRQRLAGPTDAFALDLARRGEVLVVPGEAFGAEGQGRLRLSFAAAASDLEEGVRRLAAALDREAKRAR